MVLLASWVAIVASALVYATGAVSVAINGTRFDGLNEQARDILARATPAAPHFVVYADAWGGVNGPPPVASLKVIVSDGQWWNDFTKRL